MFIFVVTKDTRETSWSTPEVPEVSSCCVPPDSFIKVAVFSTDCKPILVTRSEREFSNSIDCPARVEEESIPSRRISLSASVGSIWPLSGVLSRTKLLVTASTLSGTILSPAFKESESVPFKTRSPNSPASIPCDIPILSKSVNANWGLSFTRKYPAFVLLESVPFNWIEKPSPIVSSSSKSTTCSSSLTATSEIPNRSCITSSNNTSKVEASIGEKVSVSAVYPPPRLAPVVDIAIEIAVAMETLPNTANPAGCTAFFNSLR